MYRVCLYVYFFSIYVRPKKRERNLTQIKKHAETSMIQTQNCHTRVGRKGYETHKGTFQVV